jgi:ribonuclease VapC
VIVVDASAIVAVFQDEPEGPEFLDRLSEAPVAVMSAANWVEAAIRCDRTHKVGGAVLFDALLARLQIAVEPVTAKHAQLAREAYARFGKTSRHPAQLNFGDCFAYALAKAFDAPLLFKGDDFTDTDLKRA